MPASARHNPTTRRCRRTQRPAFTLLELLISIALVLGEYTFASLLNFDTLQVAIALQSKSNAQESVAASLASILVAALLLVGLSFVSGGRRGLQVELAPADLVRSAGAKVDEIRRP